MFVVMSAGGKPSSVKQPPPPLPPVLLMVWAALEPRRPPAGSAGATCILAKAGSGIAGMWQEPRRAPVARTHHLRICRYKSQYDSLSLDPSTEGMAYEPPALLPLICPPPMSLFSFSRWAAALLANHCGTSRKEKEKETINVTQPGRHVDAWNTEHLDSYFLAYGESWKQARLPE